MILGKEKKMLADLVSGPPRQGYIQKVEYKNLREAFLPAHEILRQNSKSSDAYMKIDYDVRIRKVE